MKIRLILKAKTSKELRKWRKKQKRGAIMDPGTFKDIEESARESGADDPKAVAGAAYWRTARKKFKERKKKRATPK